MNEEVTKCKGTCIVCRDTATTVITPMIETLPEDPEGFLDYELFGPGMFFCNKHRLGLETVPMEIYMGGQVK